MSVILNETALQFLLNDPDGPVGRDLQRRSINIVRLAQADAAEIIHLGFDVFGSIGFAIENDDLGLVSYIGGDGGRISDYLAAKDAREGRPYTRAVMSGLHI